MKRTFVLLLLLTGYLFYSSSLYAEEKKSDKPWHRWSFDLGASWVLNDSQVRLGGKGVGVEVDVEELLGVILRSALRLALGDGEPQQPSGPKCGRLWRPDVSVPLLVRRRDRGLRSYDRALREQEVQRAKMG